jgi:hypothetical protein
MLSDVSWADGRERLCAAESSMGLRRVAAWGGSRELIVSKMALGLTVFLSLIWLLACFPVYMEFFNCVHKGAFVGCVKYFHDIIDRAYGVVIV